MPPSITPWSTIRRRERREYLVLNGAAKRAGAILRVISFSAGATFALRAKMVSAMRFA